MRSDATSIKEYIDSLSADQKEAVIKILKCIRENLPGGFEEGMAFGMITWSVPLSIYPKGYHARPGQPLPFLSLAAQKNYTALYHMAVYADEDLLKWFTQAYATDTGKKPDIGKSCIRFKRDEDVPLAVLGALLSKITAADYIKIYERTRPQGKRQQSRG